MKKITSVLVANRGEIAIRVFVPVTKWESEQLRSTVKKIPYPSIASAPMSLI